MKNQNERAPHKLKKLIERAGLSASLVAKQVGFKTPSGIARYLNPDEYQQKYFKPDLVEKLIDALVGYGDPPITAEEVAELGGRFVQGSFKTAPVYPQSGHNSRSGFKEHRQDYEQPYIPVYGRAAGANEAVAFNDGQITEYVRTHPALEKVRDGFAIRYFGGSMEPRYEPNEIVYLHPTQKPATGKDCVIVLFGDDSHDEAVLKRYEGEDDEYIYASQLNPAKKLKFEKIQVNRVYAVVGRG